MLHIFPASLATSNFEDTVSSAARVAPAYLRPPCYYKLQDIKNYEFGVSSNGITFVLNVMEVRPAVLKFRLVYRQTRCAVQPVLSSYANPAERNNNNAPDLPPALPYNKTIRFLTTRSLNAVLRGQAWRADRVCLSVFLSTFQS